VLPPVAEQRPILDEVARQTLALDAAVARTENEIALLREYRTRLIADVVTGKLDVREAAARLPDETEEPEPVDEADAFTDVDGDAPDDLDAVPEESGA
jgi:type I restriction enzyme S subunit